ncbi:MAG: glycosyltransferase family 2 protein [Bacteroidales bacterium]
MDNSDLTIVIPAYNEEQSLQEYLPRLLKECLKNNWKLIVVNDGSNDNTLSVLEQHNTLGVLSIIQHKLNKGYGGALKSGIMAVNTEFIITIDADGQHKVEDVQKMYSLIKSKDADMIVGKRKFDSNIYRNTGKKLIRFFARRLMTIPIEDLNSGMKIYRTELAKRYVKYCPNGMAFSDIIALLFINNRHLVIEIPIELNNRMYGESTINTQTAITTVYEILNIVLMFNPIKIFLPAGLFFIIAGIVWEIPIAFANKGISIGASLSISIGIIIIFFGLLAEQISQIRKQL